MALILDVSTEERLRIGETTITLLKKSGRRARLRIEGPDDVNMERCPQHDAAPRDPESDDGRAA